MSQAWTEEMHQLGERVSHGILILLGCCHGAEIGETVLTDWMEAVCSGHVLARCRFGEASGAH